MGNATDHTGHSRRPPNHFCGCYSGVKQRDAMVRSFVREGLFRGDRILCLLPDAEPDRQGLTGGPFFDEAPRPRNHQLTFHRSQGIYLPDDTFDPDRALSLLVSFVHSSLELGFKGVRVVSDAAWLLDHPLGAHHVVDYENRVNTVVEGMPCTLLCLYPGRSLPKGFLAYAFLSHPYILRKGRPLFNPHYGDYDTLMNTPSADAAYATLLKSLVPTS